MRIRKIFLFLAVLALLLIAARIALPGVIHNYVNDQLNQSEEFAGHVGDIDLNLYLGAYRIDDVEIVKVDGDIPVPLFSADTVDISVLWSALLDLSIVAEVDFHNPVLNIVDATQAQDRQTGAEESWLAILNDLIPLRLDRVTVNNGELHFHNYSVNPPVDIYLAEVEAELTNLTNSRDLADSLIASLELEALAMESSMLTASMQFNPALQEPAFDLNGRLSEFPLITLDSFIKAYAPFDIEAGSIEVVTELAASDGNINGYVKPIVYQLEIFRWKEDIEEDADNPLRALWEGLVGFVGQVLRNQPLDQVATNVPISGAIDNPETNTWVTIKNIFKNAFVEAIQADFENSISFQFSDDGDQGEAQPQEDTDSR